MSHQKIGERKVLQEQIRIQAAEIKRLERLVANAPTESDNKFLMNRYLNATESETKLIALVDQLTKDFNAALTAKKVMECEVSSLLKEFEDAKNPQWNRQAMQECINTRNATLIEMIKTNEHLEREVARLSKELENAKSKNAIIPSTDITVRNLAFQIKNLAEFLETVTGNDANALSDALNSQALYKARAERAEAKLRAIEEALKVSDTGSILEHNGC